MSIWAVIWVVLMLFWLFGYGVYYYGQPNPTVPAFFFNAIIPWLCVLILGLIVFGAISAGAPVQFR